MNKEQIKGRYEAAKGKAKQVTGRITGNKELEIEGRLQKHAGKARAGIGDIGAEIKDAAAEIKQDD